MVAFLYLQVLVKELVKEMIYIMKCRIQVLYLVQIYHHSIERIFCTQVHSVNTNSLVALVFGQMNETPGARMRVSHVSLTMAEYFRDALHQDVLIFIDNVFRFLQAGSEVSTLLGRMPSAVGYQPTLCTEMGSIQERLSDSSPNHSLLQRYLQEFKVAMSL